MIKKKIFPLPDRKRDEWLNLNGEWEFSFDEPIFDKKIEVPYSWGSPLSGVEEKKDGIGFYRRSVCWNPERERIFICFGAVDYECTVFINGVEVGSHKGGYIGFEFDVTEIWEREKENIIFVAAKDPGKGENLYGKQSYGDCRGIWQTVWLESRPKTYIKKFFVKTYMDGTVQYEIDTIGAKDGTVVEASFGNVAACGKTERNRASVTLSFEKPNLWSPENPYLYEGFLKIEEDIVYTYFGIREIGTGLFGENSRRYITLNGKPYYLNGVLDQSFNPDGYFTLPSDEACREEIQRLKLIDINMMRIHIKAEEPLKLYWADRLGILVMEDIPNFWSEPTKEAKAQYEIEMEEQILRDRNHPAIFYWVTFNETWGLFDMTENEDGTVKKVYSKETADWVVAMYHKAKALDPTRFVEDNSACCLRDHTVTDVNSWHFYANGYEYVKEQIDEFCDNAYVGSGYNYRDDYKMADVPCINSECGNVWGCWGSIGESDISWQYKYMMNEFRLHDKLCGFVFTEFHDVPNEFNGFYKIDNSDKDFGYSDFGMSLRDLHSQDYVGVDFAPITTVHPGEEVVVPFFASSFSDKYHGQKLRVVWSLAVKNPLLPNEGFAVDRGEFDVLWGNYGTKYINRLKVIVPDTDGIEVLSWTLFAGNEKIMSNYIFFDIENPGKDVLSLEPDRLTDDGFEIAFCAMEGKKKNGIGSGSFYMDIKTADIPEFDSAKELWLAFEASTREPMSHDFGDTAPSDKVDMDFMLGYSCDPGANPNSFKQTDAKLYSGNVDVFVNDILCGSFLLPDCPADSRGILSHHYQKVHDWLDEAGSYGYLCKLCIPSNVFLKLKKQDVFQVTFRTYSNHGLSIFGRKSGRYPIGITFIAEK